MFRIPQLETPALNTSASAHNEFAFLLNASPQSVVDWLTDAHRTFEQETIPRIEQDFINLIHLLPSSPSLPVIFNLFLKFQMEMKLHMEIEEQKIYPIYLNQVNSECQKETTEHVHAHDGSEPFLKEIIVLLEKSSFSNNPFCQVLLTRLKRFESDLRDHAWVEDHVLVIHH